MRDSVRVWVENEKQQSTLERVESSKMAGNYYGNLTCGKTDTQLNFGYDS